MDTIHLHFSKHLGRLRQIPPFQVFMPVWGGGLVLLQKLERYFVLGHVVCAGMYVCACVFVLGCLWNRDRALDRLLRVYDFFSSGDSAGRP